MHSFRSRLPAVEIVGESNPLGLARAAAGDTHQAKQGRTEQPGGCGYWYCSNSNVQVIVHYACRTVINSCIGEPDLNQLAHQGCVNIEGEAEAFGPTGGEAGIAVKLDKHEFGVGATN